MTAKILTSQPLVDKIKNDLRTRCESLKSIGVTPSMCAVLVGDHPASLSYILNKKKICEEVGAKFSLLKLPADVAENEFLDHLKKLNANPDQNGIIIQLPVSDHLKHLELHNLVDASKDIDGFHTDHTKAIYYGTRNLNLILPCTPKGIIHLLRFYGIEVAGKNVLVIGRSLIVGKPLSMLLSNLDATVTLAHSKTHHLKDLTRSADIIISAIGKAHFITSEAIDPMRKTVIIDVGANTLNNKYTGDVSPDVIHVAAAVSPVPGGVGPMTVVCLIENLVTATENQIKGRKK
jgi:methylenetetrahydrofolate dehydrogenase (NADP+)/methenyltetrahydrofolate cyclohydrolase